jgi:hypothetical protein
MKKGITLRKLDRERWQSKLFSDAKKVSQTNRIELRLERIGAAPGKKFGKLYNYRCGLVHGSVDATKELKSGGKGPVERNAKETQDIARSTILWFMNLKATKCRLPSLIKPLTHRALLDELVP